MKELFIPKTFTAKSRIVIRQANRILEEYEARGFVLTLRQLYYQFVQRGLIPNTLKDYKRLGSIINDARLAGRMDWEMIEDRTRNLMVFRSYDNPADIITSASYGYRLDIWARQKYRPEVWIEKEALIGVIERVCQEYRVPYFAAKGYNSQSEQWRAGHRFRSYIDDGQRVLVLHLGDHDPSGVNMTEDNDQRLRMFARLGLGGRRFEIRRIALNMDQVEAYNLAPNPAKATDSRFKGYVELHGDESWELDALDPTVIDELIRAEISAVIDQDEWNAVVAEEEKAKLVMARAANRWADVAEFLYRPDYEG